MLRDYEDRKTDEKEAGRELKELREQLDKEQRRTLLKLIDRYNAYCEAQTEAAFISGFRLAAGIAMDLRGGWCSFEEEEERRGSATLPNAKWRLSQ